MKSIYLSWMTSSESSTWANSVPPDEMTLSSGISSGFALFASRQKENLGSLFEILAYDPTNYMGVILRFQDALSFKIYGIFCNILFR